MSEHDEQCPTCGRSDSVNFRNVREAKEAAENRVAELEAETGGLRTQLVTTAVQLAGYDPAQGLTGLVVEKFTAALANGEAEPTGDAFAEFAKAQGLEPNASAPVEQPSNQQHLAQLQQPVNDLRSAALPPPTGEPSIDDQIAEAERAGNHVLSRSLKNQQSKALLGLT